MDILDEFKAFITERQRIYLKRIAGEPAPWTTDSMLRAYKFTNIYREQDRTTLWCKKYVRDKYADHSFKVLAMSIVAFRFFNRIETGEAMFGSGAWDAFLEDGKIGPLRSVIHTMRGKGPYTTGAYIIKTVNGKNKLDGALWAIAAAEPVVENVAKYARMHSFMKHIPGRLAKAQALLRDAPYLGSFMAAQVIADMKYTKLFTPEKTEDWYTFAASGPGSRRGLNLLLGAEVEQPWTEKDWHFNLLKIRDSVLPLFRELGWEEPHAQDVQNMLCEFSKYKRGYSRNKFVPSK